MTRPLRVLLLPGWLDSAPHHWQSRWEARHGDRRVVQADWLWPKRGDWMARLDEVLLEDETPALLVRARLPFAAIAVSSSDDPYGAPERSAGMAREWGAERIDIGARGHTNGESGLGDWPEGRALLDRLR